MAQRPSRNQATFDYAGNRLRQVFHDGDVELEAISYPARSAFRYTFTVDLGYPQQFESSFLITREDMLRGLERPDEYEMLVQNRVEKAVRFILAQTGRAELV